MFERILKPKHLEKGDTIGIISPSGSAAHDKKKFNAGIKALEKLGFNVKLGKNVFAELDEHKNNYSAGTVHQRVEDLHWAFEDRDINAIIYSTGGKTANQLLKFIDYNLIKKNPKIFSGMSDIMTLINPIFAKTGMIGFHGPIVMYMFEFVEKPEHFLKAVSSESIGEIKPFKLNTRLTIKPGIAKGRLLGGNMSTTAKLLGTEWEPDWKNNILLLESLSFNDEYFESVMTDYDNHGIFDKISGMVIGHLDSYKGVKIEKVVNRVTEGYNFPILKIEEFGHNCTNITIPIGVKATVDATRQIFSIDESAVI